MESPVAVRIHTAMPFKTHYKKPHSTSRFGMTLVELVIVVALTLILASATLLLLNPNELTMKARDARRFADIAFLDRVIIEYKMDKGVYPDTEGTIRYSNVTTSNDHRVEEAVRGWIDADFTAYIPRLAVDPLNTPPYRYTYMHDATSYELNAVLEYNIDRMQIDGGNNANAYEVGNNLTLIL